MRINTIGIILGFLLFLSPAIQAQNTRHISLQQALQLGIANSHALKIDSAKIASAQADWQEAKDKKLPGASISGSYMRMFGADVKMASAQPGKEMPSPTQAVYGIANLSMPIYSGGRIRYGIESSKLLADVVQLAADNNKEGIAYNNIQAYVNLYKAGKAVAVIQENLQASIARDTQFSRLEQNGIMARNDLLKAQLQTSNIELSLLDAQNDLKLANINMNLLLGLPAETIIETDSIFNLQQQNALTFDEYEAQALQHRKDLQALTLQQQAAALNIRSAKALAYPSLALTGGYIAGQIPHLITITNAMNLGIGIQYNLANIWKKNTSLTKAKASATMLQANSAILNDEIQLAVSKDFQNRELANKKTEVYLKAEQQAQENFRITKNKYDNGLATITELLDANVMLLQTRLNVSAAKADAALAHYKLLQTTGTLTQQQP